MRKGNVLKSIIKATAQGRARKVNSSLCTLVTDRLGFRIVAGELRPGEIVPTETALCRSFGVSRTTVREAIKRLHGKGLVDGGPRSGTRVLPTVRWNQFDADLLRWRVAAGVDQDLLDALYEVRSCFEPRACHLAAVNGGEADRELIRAAHAAMSAEGVHTETRVAADLEFHLAIFAATGNAFFVSLGAAIRTALDLSFRLSQGRGDMSALELRLHGEVCAAILDRRGNRAEQAMRRLLDESRRTLGTALCSHCAPKPAPDRTQLGAQGAQPSA